MSGRLICLYLKIQWNFVRHILQDGFWVMPLKFGSMAKFEFLAQFPEDHLPHPVVSIYVLFWFQNHMTVWKQTSIMKQK